MNSINNMAFEVLNEMRGRPRIYTFNDKKVAITVEGREVVIPDNVDEYRDPSRPFPILRDWNKSVARAVVDPRRTERRRRLVVKIC